MYNIDFYETPRREIIKAKAEMKDHISQKEAKR
jgi:hypothetical protein